MNFMRCIFTAVFCLFSLPVVQDAGAQMVTPMFTKRMAEPKLKPIAPVKGMQIGGKTFIPLDTARYMPMKTRPASAPLPLRRAQGDAKADTLMPRILQPQASPEMLPPQPPKSKRSSPMTQEQAQQILSVFPAPALE